MCIERNIVSHHVWLAPAPAKYVSCWGPGSSLSPLGRQLLLRGETSGKTFLEEFPNSGVRARVESDASTKKMRGTTVLIKCVLR